MNCNWVIHNYVFTVCSQSVICHTKCYVQLLLNSLLGCSGRCWTFHNCYAVFLRRPLEKRQVLRFPTVDISMWMCRDIFGDTFHEAFMSLKTKSCENMVALTLFPMVQSSPNFAHAMTAQLSCHVWNWNLIWPSIILPEQFSTIFFKIWISHSPTTSEMGLRVATLHWGR